MATGKIDNSRKIENINNISTVSGCTVNANRSNNVVEVYIIFTPTTTGLNQIASGLPECALQNGIIGIPVFASGTSAATYGWFRINDNGTISCDITNSAALNNPMHCSIVYLTK